MLYREVPTPTQLARLAMHTVPHQKYLSDCMHHQQCQTMSQGSWYLVIAVIVHEATQDCTYLTLGEEGDRDGTLLCPTSLQYRQQSTLNQQTETNHWKKRMNKWKQTNN